MAHRHRIWADDFIAAGAFAHIRQDEDADPPTNESDGMIIDGDGYERKAIDSIVTDQTGKVEVNDNQFVLRGAGVWDYWIRVPGRNPALWKSILWNDTDDAPHFEDGLIGVGDSARRHNQAGGFPPSHVTSYISGRLTLFSDREFEIRTNSEDSTLCTAAGFEGPDEIYTEALFRLNPTSELIHFQHREDAGVDGGNAGQQVWVTRPITVLKHDDTGGASLNSNQMTVPAGTYFVTARAVAHGVNQNKLALYNVTDDTTELFGLNSYAGSSGPVEQAFSALLFGKITLASPKTFELQIRNAVADISEDNELGIATGAASADATEELYASVEFRRLPAGSTSKYIHIVHEEDRGISGGTFTSGAYQVRPLTTILTDDTGEVTLNSDQFILPNGTYILTGFGQAFACENHRMNLWEVGVGQILFGATEDSGTGSGPAAFVGGLFSVTDGPKTFEIRHRCSLTRSTNGFGISISGPPPHDDFADMNERYADIILEKIA